MSGAPVIVTPRWPAPACVRAASTTRLGGVSAGPLASLNMGFGRDDDGAVQTNRARVAQAIGLDRPACWLRQVHGNVCVDAATAAPEVTADASYTTGRERACVVMTADCLPVVLAADDGSAVAVAHAGWRGLAGGVLEHTVRATAMPGDRLLAWLGPAIGGAVYEVGADVRDAFVAQHADDAVAFTANRPGHWLADLAALARARLARRGVERVYEAGECTYSAPERYYSFRRDGSTGRMATFAWLTG